MRIVLGVVVLLLVAGACAGNEPLDDTAARTIPPTTPPTAIPTETPAPSPTPVPPVLVNPFDPVEVAEWQRTLNDHGYGLQPDGIWGPATLAATKDFQAANGLAATGAVRSATWTAAFGVESSTPLPTLAQPTPTSAQRPRVTIRCPDDEVVSRVPYRIEFRLAITNQQQMTELRIDYGDTHTYSSRDVASASWHNYQSGGFFKVRVEALDPAGVADDAQCSFMVQHFPRTAAIPTTRPASQPACHPSYSPCLQVVSDYDCAGGSGNGPYYTGRVTVSGWDEYGLDRDGDGIGCDWR